MRPPKILCHADVLNSTSHVGTKINIFERLHWVRIQGRDVDDIAWWPGLLYKGFLELMVDLDWRLSELRAGCLTRHKRSKHKPAIVYLLGPIPFASSIAYIKEPGSYFGLDEAGRDGPELKNYYDFYEEMVNAAKEAPSADKNRQAQFTQSVEFADRILDAADVVELEDSGGGLPLMLPIEDGFAAGSVKAIGDGVESVVKPRRVESGSCPPAAPQAASIDSTSRVSHVSVSHRSGDPLKSGAEGGGGGKRSSATPDTSAMSPDSGSSGSGGISTDLSFTDLSWRELWDHLRNRGWGVVRARNNLHDWYYHPKDCDPSSKDTTLGIDYFQSTDDVMEWYKSKRAKNKSDFVQHNTPDSISDRKSIPSPMSDESNTPDSKGDENYAPSPRAYNSEPSDGLDDIEDLIQNGAVWNTIWKALFKLGWHYAYGAGLIHMYYMKKGKSRKDTLGEDYFTSEEAVIEYIVARNERIVQDGESPPANTRSRKRKSTEPNRVTTKNVHRVWGRG